MRPDLRRRMALWCALTVLSCLAAADVLSERRLQVERMSPAQKQILVDNQQRLLKLEPDEQQKLRAFAAELEQDPDAERLRSIMLRYEAWMHRLPIDVRSGLMLLAADERVARIKRLLEDESRMAAKQLSAEDANRVANWIERRMLENMPREQRERLEQAGVADRHRMIARLVWQRSQQTGMLHGFNFRAQDLQALGDSLSPAARRQMGEALVAHRAQQLIGDWIRQSLGIFPGPQSSGGLLPRGGPAGEFRAPYPREGEGSGRPRQRPAAGNSPQDTRRPFAPLPQRPVRPPASEPPKS